MSGSGSGSQKIVMSDRSSVRDGIGGGDDIDGITGGMSLKRQKKEQQFRRFWRRVGILLQVCALLALAFTVMIGLRTDDYIDWSWWLVFTPLFAIVVVSLMASASRPLANAVPWIVRAVWCVWVLGSGVCSGMITVHLSDLVGGETPSAVEASVPFFIAVAVTLIAGVFSLIRGSCFMKGDRARQHVFGGLLMLFVGLTVAPSMIMGAFRVSGKNELSWSVIFIPLFVGDAIAGCFAFCLLIFSFGGRDSSSFSIFQMISFELVIFCSIAFKIVFALQYDNNLNLHTIILLIPVLIGEVFLFFCGTNILIRPPKPQEDDESSIKIKEDEETLINQKVIGQEEDDDYEEEDDDEESPIINHVNINQSNNNNNTISIRSDINHN